MEKEIYRVQDGEVLQIRRMDLFNASPAEFQVLGRTSVLWEFLRIVNEAGCRGKQLRQIRATHSPVRSVTAVELTFERKSRVWRLWRWLK